MDNTKISSWRYGRLLAVLYLRENSLDDPKFPTLPIYIAQLPVFLDRFHSLPTAVQHKIINCATHILQRLHEDQSELIQSINSVSRNRKWENFEALDKSLLLIGCSELQHTKTLPIIIKEMLIVSDMLGNQQAAPYISGILKSLAYGDQTPDLAKKKGKIRLKDPSKDITHD